MTQNPNFDRAERELLAAISDSDLIDDLPAGEANSYAGRRARYRAGVAIKAAAVNALLAVAVEVRELVEAVKQR